MSKTTLYGVVGTVIFLIALAIAIFGGDGAQVPPATKEVAQASGAQSSGWFWGFFILGTILYLAWTLSRMSSVPKATRGKFNEYVPPEWVFVFLVGLPLVHWFVWSFAPTFWNTWFDSKAFWPANFVIVAIFAVVRNLYGQKIRFKWVFWPAAIVGVVLLFNSWKEDLEYEMRDYLRDKSIGGLPILARNTPLSPEATLAIIAECKSGGRHVDDEGNLIINENEDGTTDIGLFQINSVHEDRAKGLGLDIRTEGGNRAYALILFSEEGTEPWRASRHCWGESIYAWEYEKKKPGSGVVITTKKIQVGKEWSEWARNPPGQMLHFEPMDVGPVSYEAEIQDGKVYKFSRESRVHERIPLLQKVRFRATDEEVETFQMWLRYSAL